MSTNETVIQHDGRLYLVQWTFMDNGEPEITEVHSECGQTIDPAQYPSFQASLIKAIRIQKPA
jgi:hypothetical protein